MKNASTARKRLSTLILGLMTALGSVDAQKVGTTSMQFLRVMPVARGTALGEAYASLATGAEALFWNPGGLPHISGLDVTSTYVDWLFDTRQGALGAAMTVSDMGTIGLQIQFVDYGVFDEAIADPALLSQPPYPGLTGRQFRPYSYLLGVSYARMFTNKFSAGLSAKFAHESLFGRPSVSILNDNGGLESVNTFANGFLFDFGLLYNTGFRTIRIAGVIQNFGGSMKYAKEASPAPLLFRLGISADVFGADGLFVTDAENRTTASFEMFQPNDYTQQIHAGIEYEYREMIALRAGYKFNYDVEGLTLGGGIRQEVAGTPLRFDYSYSAMGEYLGMAHRISIGASF